MALCCFALNTALGQCSANFTSSKTKYCLHDTSRFTAIGSNLSPSYSWDFDDPYSGSENTDTSNQPKHIFSHTGWFNVSLIVNDGTCKDTITHTILILDLPIAKIKVLSPCLASSTSLASLSSSDTLDQISSYSWQYGDGTTGTGASTLHTYAATGNNTVLLKITTTNGCIDSANKSISIFDKLTLIKSFDSLCQEDEIDFDVNTGTSTAAQWQWDFGDSTTGNISNPLHQYSKSGLFKPQITVTYSNGAKCSAADAVYVYALPDASFYIISDSIQCYKNNQVCIKLNNPNQLLTRRSVAFDDGFVDDFSPLTDSIVCHTYTDAGGSKYTLSISILDNHFCAASYNVKQKVTIHPLLIANFDNKASNGCFGTPVTINNLSNFRPPFVKKFKWTFGDGAVDSSTWSSVYHKYVADGQFSIKLFLKDTYNCIDSMTSSNTIRNTTFVIDAKRDSMNGHCYSRNRLYYSQTPIAGAGVRWYLGSQDSSFGWKTAAYIRSTGTFKSYIRIDKNGCDSITYIDTFVINGPIARYGLVSNQYQCQIKDTVELTNSSITFRNGPLSIHWDAVDIFANNCTIDTKNGNNLNMNCRYSIDSLIFRHMYKPGKENCYYPKIVVSDSLTGCNDSVTINLPLRPPDASQGLPFFRSIGCIGPEQYKTITLDLSRTQPICGREAAWTMWDSTCAANSGNFNAYWNLNSRTHNYGYDNQPCDSNGFVTIGIIIQNGKDSFGRTCRDTAFYHNVLQFQKVDPRFTSNYNPNIHYCKNSTITFFPDTKYQDSIGSMVWDWGDGSSTNGINFSPTPHTFKQSGFYKVVLTITMINGCAAIDSTRIKIGLSENIGFLKGEICLDDTVQLLEHINYWGDAYPWWSNASRAGQNKETLKWDIGDGNGFSVSGGNPFIQYNKIGNYSLRVAIKDSMDCLDTIGLKNAIRVFNIKSNFTVLKDTFVCDQLIAFKSTASVYDSIHHFGHPDDYVASFIWRFKPGTSFSTLKNPYKFLKAGTHLVSYTATNSRGCKDSTVKNVVVIGPTSQYEFIGDTIGCQPLTVQFKNSSKDANSYTWSFKDSSNNTYSTNADTNVSYQFKSYGKFYPVLTARGKFKSNGFPVTCQTVFPDTTIAGFREVTVYETPQPNFTYSTNCNTNTTAFTNTSKMKSAVIDRFEWDFGDGDTSMQTNPIHQFTDTGRYVIILKAYSPKGCTDTIIRKIVISPFPVTRFSYNLTCLGKTTFFIDSTVAFNDRIFKWSWDFGDSTFSNLRNPSKKYFKDSSYNVKLTTTNLAGCSGTLTKTVVVHPQPKANFTFVNTCLEKAIELKDSTNSKDTPLKLLWRLGDNSTDSTAIVLKKYAGAGNKTVKIICTTASGCMDSVIKTIHIYAKPLSDFSIAKKEQCLRNNLFVFKNNSTTDTGSLTYHWTFGNGLASIAKDTTLTYAAIGSYTIQLITNTANNCKDTATDSVLLDPHPATGFQINNIAQCYNINHFIFIDTSHISKGSFTRKWNTGDNQNYTDSFLLHRYNDSGNYSVQLSLLSDKGCADTLQKNVRVHPQPSAQFTIDSIAKCLRNNLFKFTNTSTTPYGSNTYRWFFGDGDSLQSTNATHSYISFDTFAIQLIATNSNLCRDTISKTVIVHPMPNAQFSIDDSLQCTYANAFSFTNRSNIQLGMLTYNWNTGDGNGYNNKDLQHSYTKYGNYKVTLTATSNQNCIDSTVHPLEVYAMPLPAFTINDAGQCEKNNNFIFTDSSKIGLGTYSIYWNLGDNSNSNLSKVSKTYNTAGTYLIKLTLTSNQGCKDSLSKSITLFPKPTPLFIIDKDKQCERNNLFNFTNQSSIITGRFNNTWEFGDGKKTTSQNAIHTYDTFGVYFVKLITESDSACSDSITKNITVEPMPLPAFAVNKIAQCLNDQLFKFTDTSKIGLGTYQRLWTLGELDSSALANPNKLFKAFGLYTIWLKLTSDKGCFDSTKMDIEVYPKPLPSFSINDSTQCINTNHFIFKSTSNIPNGMLKTYWNFGDAITDSLNLVTHNYKQYGIYRIQLTSVSDKGCTDSTFKPVEVYPKPTSAIVANDSSQCENTNWYVFNSIISIPYTNITKQYWNLDNIYIQGSSDTFKHYNNYGPYISGLIAESEYGCRDTSLLKIDVLPIPTAGFSINKANQCENDNQYIFTNSSTVPYGKLSYLWNFGNGETDTTQSPKKIFTIYDSLDVTLIARTVPGCEDTAILPVVIYPKPLPQFSISDSTQCVNGNLLILTNNSSIPIGTYSSFWTFGDGNSSNAKDTSYAYAQFGLYKVRLNLLSDQGCRDSLDKTITIYPKPIPEFSINDTGQCLNNQSFVFENLSTISYGPIHNEWRFGDFTKDTTTSPIHQYASYGNFIVELMTQSQYDCRDSIKIPVRVFASPFSQFSVNDTDQCVNTQIFNFTSNSKIPQGKIIQQNWFFTDNGIAAGLTAKNHFKKPGYYNALLVVKSDSNCIDSFIKPLRVYPKPIAKFMVNDSAQCLYENAYVFTETAFDSIGVSTYEWDINSEKKVSTTSVNHIFKTVGYKYANLIVTSVVGCKDTTQRDVYVKAMPDPLFNKLKSYYCRGEMAFNLIPKTLGGTFFGKNILASDFVAQHLWKDTVKYVVTVNGCTDSSFQYTNVYPKPEVHLGNDTLLCKYEYFEKNISFWNSTYKWNTLRDDSVFRFNRPGIFWVTVSNICGTASDTIEITFRDYNCHFYMPNAFSPNGDGINDFFMPILYGVDRLEFEIYNRWGEKVYMGDINSKGWDGNYQNEPAQQEVYLWRVGYSFMAGNQRVNLYEKGMFTLLR